MPFRFYFLFSFFTLLFLFYPGDSPYYNLFAHHRELLSKEEAVERFVIKPIPVVRTNMWPEVSAEGVYVVDLASFTPVLERNPHERLFPASTTKVITALVAMDVYKPDSIITVSRIMPEGQTMGLFSGERITVENLLYGTLVHSGNDAAYALADGYGFDKFIELMNTKAQQLGMKDSHFANPAGLDDMSQLSTPYDLAIAGRALLSNPLLKKMVSTKEITIPDVDFRVYHKLTNVNKLLGDIQGLGGLKTGYTESAGENLISFYRSFDYKSKNHEFIIVILKSKDRFEDTRSVIKWIEANVEYASSPTKF